MHEQWLAYILVKALREINRNSGLDGIQFINFVVNLKGINGNREGQDAKLYNTTTAKWSRKTKNENGRLAGFGVYALRLKWRHGKEGKDKCCGVFTRLRAVRGLRSDMW